MDYLACSRNQYRQWIYTEVSIDMLEQRFRLLWIKWRTGRSPGLDDINLSLAEYIDTFTPSQKYVWVTKKEPESWRILSLFKTGSCSAQNSARVIVPNDYGAISLLNAAYKVYCTMINMRFPVSIQSYKQAGLLAMMMFLCWCS